jgi:hypothetical protein
MPYSPGDVLYVWVDSTYLHGFPAKDKYVFCVDRTQHMFFYINSDPWRKQPNTQVSVSNLELTFLPKAVSYIDTRVMLKFPYSDIDPQIQHDAKRNKGAVPPAVRARIKAVALAHGQLLGWQERLLERNL